MMIMLPVGGGLLSCLKNPPNALSPCMVQSRVLLLNCPLLICTYRMSKNLKRKSPSRRRSKVQKLTYLSPESQSSTDDEWEPEILKEPRITDNDDVPSGSGKHFSIHLFLNLEIFLWTEHAILEHSLNILNLQD